MQQNNFKPSIGESAPTTPIEMENPSPNPTTQQRKYAGQLSFEEVNEAALDRLDEVLDVLGLWEDSKQVGKQVQMLNPKRNDCELGSFTINTETGVWADFAVDDASGGDIVSLAAYITDKSQVDARNVLANALGLLNAEAKITLPVPVKAGKGMAEKKADEICIMPIPDAMANTVLAKTNDPNINLGSWGGVAVHSIKAYSYRNASGQINAFMLRYNLANGKKEPRPYSCWQQAGQQPKMKFGAPAKPYTLYNLDLLVQYPDAPILVVEGEKSADAASMLFPDYVVVSTMFGAQSPMNSDLMPLVGRQVKFWQDNDEAGTSYIKKIADYLYQQSPNMVMAAITPPKFKAGKGAEGHAILEPREDELPAGWDAANALEEGWTPGHIQLLPPEQYVKYQATEQQKNGKVNTYANDFEVRNGILKKATYNPDLEKMVYHDVCSELVVVGQTRDENGQNWGQLVQLHDRDARMHELPIPRELLANGSGESFVKALLSRGLVVYNEKLLKEYVMTAKHPGRALCVKQIGWHGNNAFVLPEKTYGESEERVILQTSDLSRFSAYSTSGTLEEWQREVASLCAGNSRLMLAVSVSLAGPFLRLMSIENGGFHFRGKSSSGKSKTLFTAASVWGSNQMVRVWRTTDNAVESLALSHNDTVLCLDELGQVDAAKAGDIAYTLANGLSKARSTQSGGIRNITRWRLLFLSTGEIGLADHMETVGKSARPGQEVRMLDIPADVPQGMGIFETIHDSPSPSEFADRLQEKANLYHGSAGEALLERLTHLGEIKLAVEFVQTQRDEFVRRHAPSTAHGQIQRAAGRFGFVAAVGEYCIVRGILPFTPGDVSSAIAICFNAWLDERGGDQALEDTRAVSQVKAFLERYGESRFSSMNEYSMSMGYATRTNVRAGFKHDSGDYWVLPEMYRQDICGGLDTKLVTRVLKQHGFLELDRHGNAPVNKRIPGIGPTRVYIIKAAILQIEEEQPEAA